MKKNTPKKEKAIKPVKIEHLTDFAEQVARLKNDQEFVQQTIAKRIPEFTQNLKSIQEKLLELETRLNAKDCDYATVKKELPETTLQEIDKQIKKWQEECNQLSAKSIPEWNTKISGFEALIKGDLDLRHAQITGIKKDLEALIKNIQERNASLESIGASCNESMCRVTAIKTRLKVNTKLNAITGSTQLLAKNLEELNELLTKEKNPELQTKTRTCLLLLNKEFTQAKTLWELASPEPEKSNMPTPSEQGVQIHVDESKNNAEQKPT